MAHKVHVEGIVQGVGFRPFVFRLAKELGLSGWVHNATDGVHILVEGSDEGITEFLRRLESDKPPAAVISQISAEETTEHAGEGFSIRKSDTIRGERTFVSPDLATCSDCLSELLNPADRRHHYPFINCTNCGPRFTIIEQLPYDRAYTSMANFELCETCTQEYNDALDRRFHAQPNACFCCGPQLELSVPESVEQAKGLSVEQSDALIRRCAELLAEGKTIAVKGLGGYHLVCDATNERAVARLRLRKQRPRKPLAVMVASLKAAEQRFAVNDTEAALLISAAAPIVLLKSDDSKQVLPDETCSSCMSDTPLAASVTCGLTEVGVMLPSTPVQHLLMRAVGKPLVMTSGNISEEPIIGDDGLAQSLLGEVADAFLLNNRPIVSRYDDSVVRVLSMVTGDTQEDSVGSLHVTNELQYVRRARGYAPAPLKLPFSVPDGQVFLAAGPEQKSTFCLASQTDAFVSQHLGDLAHASSLHTYLETITLYTKLFALQPSLFVADMHPEYLSTKWAREQAADKGLPLIEVQHHHAHVAAVIAENMIRKSTSSQDKGKRGADKREEDTRDDGRIEEGIRGDGLSASEKRSLTAQQNVIGIALDGTGYGTDGTIWGGEVLIVSLLGFSRFAHVECFHLPGAAQAIKHPLRATYALLLQQGFTEHPAAQSVKERLGLINVELIEQMIRKGINSPLTSSAGRLFDAVSALLGICDEASYEGEPAILLEAAMGANNSHNPLVGLQEENSPPGNFSDNPYVIPTRGIILTILNMMQAGVSTSELSQYFHNALMQAFVRAAILAREHTGLETVALSGGVFNNRFIASHMPGLLQDAGFEVLTHKYLPPNDGCISYGQAAIACAKRTHSL